MYHNIPYIISHIIVIGVLYLMYNIIIIKFITLAVLALRNICNVLHTTAHKTPK